MAKGKTDARTAIGQKCTKCGHMRRHTFKNTKNTVEKMERMKYCPNCRSVQVFKEAKIGK